LFTCATYAAFLYRENTTVLALAPWTKSQQI
jgi:hypothetical protein